MRPITIAIWEELKALLSSYRNEEALRRIMVKARFDVETDDRTIFSKLVFDRLLQAPNWFEHGDYILAVLKDIDSHNAEDRCKVYDECVLEPKRRKKRIEEAHQAELERIRKITEEKKKRLAEQRCLEIEKRKKIEDAQRIERERLRAIEEEKRQRAELLRKKQEEEAMRLKLQILSEIKAEHDNLSEAQELADADRTRRLNKLWGDLRRVVVKDYLSADSFFENHPDKGLIGLKDFDEAKNKFVKYWIKKHTPSGKSEEKYVPDDEQTVAIATSQPNIQVVARAGSGKTTTLAGRTLFLIRHCGVNPNEMLLLAFNSKAAVEMKRKLLLMLCPTADQLVAEDIKTRKQKQIRHGRLNMLELEGQSIDSVAKEMGVSMPFIMTFHALAYAIVHPEEDLLYDDDSASVNKHSSVVQDIIDDHIKSPETESEIRTLMLAHYKGEWETITKGGFNIVDKGEFLAYRRSLPRRSLKGHEAKSYGEKVIADFLFEHDVSYKYERNKNWNGINYRPDFTLFPDEEKGSEKGVVIEYFGLNGDPDYDEMSDKKRDFWKENWEKKRDFKLIEFSPKDIGGKREEFEAKLKQILEREGFKCEKLSEDEIWNRIEKRAVGRFSKAMKAFIGRCRKLSLTPIDLKERIYAHKTESEVEKQFVDLGLIFYRDYLSRLTRSGKEDFDGLIQRAITLIESDVTVFDRKSGGGNLKSLGYIFMDEFQDFSDLFYRLISLISKKNPSINLFAVGDDWQAINGFAGSDLRFFQNFDTYMGEAEKLYISTNYRSRGKIVDLGNLLMDGRGEPARASHEKEGQITRVDVNSFQPSEFEKDRYSGDFITPIILRIIKKTLARQGQVVLLSRTNNLPYYVAYNNEVSNNQKGLERYLSHIRSFLPEDVHGHINISTAHKYKGLEKDTVIIIDAVAKSYPLIHPDWVFTRVFGDSVEEIIEEDRRLFYVALTRAENNLYIVTDETVPTPFLRGNIESTELLGNINWNEYPPLRDGNSMVTILLANQEDDPTPTTSIIQEIKKCGYGPKTNSAGWVGWAKLTNANDFDIESLTKEVWFKQANGVEIRILDESDEIQAVYHVNKGQLQEVRRAPH